MIMIHDDCIDDNYDDDAGDDESLMTQHLRMAEILFDRARLLEAHL